MSNSTGRGPAIPTLRASGKARRACRTCSARKTKCDLGRPRCGRCVVGGMDCSYDSPPVALASTPSPGQATNVGAPGADHTAAAAPAPSEHIGLTAQILAAPSWPMYRGQTLEGEQRVLEGRALLSYMQRVSKPQNSESWITESFLKSVIAVGHEHPFLMHGIISVGALNQALGKGVRDAKLLTIVYTYAARSIAGQLAAVQSGLHSRNFDAVFMAAALTTFQVIVQRKFATPEPESLAGIVDWLHPFRSFHYLTKASNDLFNRSPFSSSPFGQRHGSVEACRSRETDKSDFRFLLQGQPRMSTPQRIFAVYRDVVDYLGVVYHKRRRKLHNRFLLEAPPVFVQCLERCEPTALLLMGVYFALTRILDLPLLSDEVSERELSLISAHLPTIHKRLLQRVLDLIGP